MGIESPYSILQKPSARYIRMQSKPETTATYQQVAFYSPTTRRPLSTASLSEGISRLKRPIQPTNKTQPKILLMDQIEAIKPDLYNADEMWYSPTSHAKNTAIDLVKSLKILHDHLPQDLVSGDGDGGISISWGDLQRNVSIEIPSDDSDVPYLYWQIEGDHGLVTPVTAQEINDHLRRVLG